MKILSVVLSLFGTFLLVYSTIVYEPPAVVAFIFGIATGLNVATLTAMWLFRKKDNDHD